MSTNKKELRKQFKTKRQQLTKAFRKEADKLIADRVLDKIKTCSDKPVIYCYVSTPEETDTHLILSQLWENGYRTAVPKVTDRNGIMYFYEIHDFSDLQEGYYHIFEPIDTKKPVTDPGIMIMPGVAFDQDRNRLGYGGGFYDRFLTNNSFITDTIAIAYEIQIADQIPTEGNDICPNHIITERNIYE